MSDQTARLVERLRTRLRRVTRRMSWAELAFGGAVALGSVAALLLVATLLEATLWLEPNLRTGLVVLGGACLLGVSAAFLARPLGRLLGVLDGPSDEDIARTVGEHHPAVADRLVNLLQLAEGQRSHAPAPYVDRAVQHLAEQIDDVPFDEVADFQPAQMAARWAALPLLAVLGFLVAAPSTFLDASERLLAPQTRFDRPAPFDLAVTPGDARLIKGDSLRVTVRTTGTPPDAATLLLHPQDSDSPRRIALQADTTGTFRHLVPNLRQSLRYRVVASPVRTAWYEVDVAQRPFLRRLQVQLAPPGYTDRPARELAPNVGDVNALPGTRVTVTATLGGAPVSEATLDFEDGSAQPLSLTEGVATGDFILQREDTYVLRLQSENGIPNRDPIRYEVSLQADARPSVSFLEPEGIAELTPALTQQLRLQLSDDYGFRRAELFYRRVDGDSSFTSIELPLSEPQEVDQVLSHTWLLVQDSDLDLQRGDEVAYYVKAWDNDAVNGPKSGRTATQRLRFPSLSEQYEEVDTLQQSTGEQMRQLDRESETVQQQFRKLRDELRRTRQADWEDRRQLERMQQKQESLSQGKKELARQVDSLNQEMRRNDLSSPETSKKLEELKRTVDEMQSKDLQEALQKLQKAMQDQSFRKIQSSMQSTKSRLEQQKQQMERTLNLFEQLRARMKMEELTRRTEDLRKQEAEIEKKTSERMEESDPSRVDSSSQSEDSSPTPDSTSPDSGAMPPASPSDSSAATRSDSASAATPPDSLSPPRGDSTSTPRSDSLSAQRSPSPDSSANKDLAREQEQLSEEMKKLMKEMKKAKEDMGEVPSAPKKKLQKLQKKMEQQDLPEKMRQNSQQLRKNELSKARRQQRQLQKQLQNMKSQLSQMNQQMQSQQRQMNITGLRSALENTLRLSKDQEDLRKTVERLEGDGPTVRRYAVTQQSLTEGVENLADSLQSIAGRMPQMSKAVQKKTGNSLRAMEKSITALDEREAQEATGYQKTSMMHLNDLALLLSRLLDKMQQQQSGGSGKMSMQQAMQQLQKASGQQQKLNKQIQKFLNKAQGQRLSKDGQARRRQLAKQQRQIKQQLEEMNVGEETKQKLMGDLQKIAKQMEKSAEDLEGGRHSRDLIKRQQQILTRLLNAQQSLRTQGKKQQRRGRRAEEEADRTPPGERPDQDEVDALRRDLIRALDMGYNSDYEELIKRYFELLQENKDTER